MRLVILLCLFDDTLKICSRRLAPSVGDHQFTRHSASTSANAIHYVGFAEKGVNKNV